MPKQKQVKRSKGQQREQGRAASAVPIEQIDFLIAVPTVGDPDVLGPTMDRLMRHVDGTRSVVSVLVNPASAESAAASARLLDEHARCATDGVRLIYSATEGPVGFARACNLAVERGLAPGYHPRMVVLLNDDVDVTPGWLQGLQRAAESSTVRLYGEPVQADRKPDRPVAQYGRIGLVGPASDNVAGLQSVPLAGEEAHMAATQPEVYAARFREMNPGNVMTCDFLSGFCLGVTWECYLDLAGPLLDERYGIGGFEDNDLCVRSEKRGWRCAIAGDTFVHHRAHRTLDRHFAGQMRGLANRLTYYRKWAQPRDHHRRLVACYRLGWTFANDLHLTRGSLLRAAHLCDGIAIVLTGNPLDITQAHDWQIAQGTLSPVDVELLNACNGADAKDVADAFRRWVVAHLEELPNSRFRDDVRVEVWTGEWNERDERNRAIAIAEEMGADWLLSIDHDEVLEDRVTRRHLERLMHHPDPLVRSWDFGWLNHWDSQRLVRVDPPWGDGLRYATGMRGFRLWRAGGRRIMAGTEIGLHCGNCPDYDSLAKRITGIRFRHYGYIRLEDRMFKQARYQRLDPRPNAALTGNASGYEHLTNEEGMVLVPYVRHNGIGLTMLVHAREEVEDLARWLDLLYGIVDRIVLVWTDTQADAPTPAHAEVAALYGAEWVIRRFDDDLAACRNAGLDALRAAGDVGWALVIDPDEWLPDPWSAMALRRMAENSDSYGFMFRFQNLRPPETREPPTMSESVRLIRLDPDGVMRYSNRVHEGFDAAMAELHARGVHPQIRIAPFVVNHRGLAGDDVAIDGKLQKYTRMLFRELRDHPDNANAWTSLGLQYGNEGRYDEARTCYEMGCQHAGQAYLPFKELALWHLRIAKRLYHEVVPRVAQAHDYHPTALEIARFLDTYAPEQPLVGMARRGQSTSRDWLPPLQWFLGEIGRAPSSGAPQAVQGASGAVPPGGLLEDGVTRPGACQAGQAPPPGADAPDPLAILEELRRRRIEEAEHNASGETAVE